MKNDIRWIQRLSNYEKALNRLAELVELASERDLSEIEKEALIQRFTYTYELSWNVIKDFFESLGEVSISGSKDAFVLAQRRNLIVQAQVLIDTIKSRQLACHAYDEEKINTVFHDIVEKYYNAFEELRQVLVKEKKERNL